LCELSSQTKNLRDLTYLSVPGVSKDLNFLYFFAHISNIFGARILKFSEGNLMKPDFIDVKSNDVSTCQVVSPVLGRYMYENK
jgi:hypothetical protein